MKILFRLCLMIGFLLGGFYSTFSQKRTSNKKNSYILSFSPIYSSNIVDIHSNGYDDLYLITSDKSFKIDIVMSTLSNKNYTSMPNILDTLSRSFNLYTIVKDSSSKYANTNKITQRLTDYNNYTTGYLFFLNDAIKKNGSVVGYIIRRYTLKGKILYSVLKSNCNDYPYECKAVIKKLE